MAEALNQTDSIGLAQLAQRLGRFSPISDSEIIILAIKPSLAYVLLICGRWLSVLLPLSIASAILVQLVWLTGYAGMVLILSLGALTCRLGIGLLQWQSRAYILTNLRVLRIRGLLRVEMLQCALLQIKDVLLTTSPGEKMLGLGTLSLLSNSSDSPVAHWRNIRHPEQVRRQILEAIDALKGRSPQGPARELPHTTILPVAQSRPSVARTKSVSLRRLF